MTRIVLLALILSFLSCKSEKNKENIKIQQNSILEKQSIEGFDKYNNVRFGFSIEYPKNILFPQNESLNGDGLTFKNKNGDDALIVFGRRNEDPEGNTITLEKEFNENLKQLENESGVKVTYKKLGKTFYVLSGYREKKIFYQKTIQKEYSFANAILYYDESQKDTYDKILEDIFKTLK